jgi:predicted CopG family antitoxin
MLSDTGITLLTAYIQIYGMVKTIRVSEEYHEWLSAHKHEDETMEETLRRMTRGPHPNDVAGLLSAAEADEAKAAVEELRARDGDRFEDAQAAFDDE